MPDIVAGDAQAPIRRAVWLGLALSCIALGLLINRLGFGLSPTTRDVTGDALWAVMMFAWIGVLLPRRSMISRGALTLAICWAVEFSQTYHTPMLDAWRQTTPGRLVLGVGFDARDLLAYAAGVAVSVLLERMMRSRASLLEFA